VKAGTVLGPYEIVDLLGAGGMGVVYRARDTRLGRMVAIKVLPAEYAIDPERLRRFEQEARTVAALSHTNILALYDVGTHEGRHYLVTELLEGKTLEQRLRGVPLSIAMAVEIAVQIAKGLAAAHEKGIVHRDIKPSNVFITADGTAKILDFGVAKLTQPEKEGSSPLTTTSTANAVLGTVAYMSPEQARGSPTDQRSDLFSLGAVLYEMLSGRSAFARETAADTVSAILNEEPPALTAIHPCMPGNLDGIVRHCLEKQQGDRFQTARDLVFDLRSLSGVGLPATSAAGTDTRPWRPSRLREATAWAVAALSLTGLLVISLLPRAFSPRLAAVVRTTIAPPEGTEIPGRGLAVGLALSPDGGRLAFVGSTGSTSALYVRRLDSLTAEALPGTARARHPFWSPDGSEVGFFADRKLKVVHLTGGAIRVLCETGQYPFGGAWAPDGTIYFSPEVAARPIFKVGSQGGAPEAFTVLDSASGETGHGYPALLPGGRHLLFGTFNDIRSLGVRIASLDDGKAASFLPGALRAEVYASHVVFVEGDTLFRARLEAKTLRPTGPRTILGTGLTEMAMDTSFSLAAGALAYLLPARSPSSNLSWIDAGGRRLGTVGSSSYYRNPLISPDGTRIATDIQSLGDREERAEVRVLDLRAGKESRLTADLSCVTDAVWSPDGSRLALMSWTPTAFRILEVGADGSGEARTLCEGSGMRWPRDWAPDGEALLLDRLGDPETAGDIMVLWLRNSTVPERYRATKANETSPRFSRDGRHVAFASDETGRDEIYVAGFPEPSIPRLVSDAGGRSPKWARDGSALYYLSLDEEIIKVAVHPEGDTLAFGPPTKLFRARIIQYTGHAFDVDTDGSRFIVATAHDAGSRIVLLQNWAGERGP